MTKEWHVRHAQDRYDAVNELEGIKLPYILMKLSQRPRDGLEYDKWSRLNSFLHRGIIPVFSKVSGYMEDEAKSILQINFALVEEHLDYYLVESVSGMSVSRLIAFIEACQQFLVINFGEQANKLLIENTNKYLRTKKIKK